MHLTYQQKQSLRQGLLYILLGMLAALLYLAQVNEIHLGYAVLNSLLIAFILAFVLAICELWLFRRQVRRMRFITLFLIRCIVYFVAVVATTFNIFVISRARRFNLSYSEVINSEDFQEYLHGPYIQVVFYIILVMGAVNFTSQMSRKLGPGMLWATLTGKYKTPVKQERIVMFIDLIESARIIKKLGPAGYHSFLNDVIFDITEPILMYGGNVMHYVDDEIVVTWPFERGTQNSNCIRAYLELKHELQSLHERYYSKYETLPGIRTALHCGSLVQAEVGIVKSEVCIVGDVVNTTSRILDECIYNDFDILISEDLMNELSLPVNYQYTHVAKVSMKGKENLMHLHTIKKSGNVLAK